MSSDVPQNHNRLNVQYVEVIIPRFVFTAFISPMSSFLGKSMRVFLVIIVLNTKPHFDVMRTYCINSKVDNEDKNT